MIDTTIFKRNQQIEYICSNDTSKANLTIIEEVGAGATSIVYQANLDDGTLAAVKSYREIESKARNYQNELSALQLLSQFPDPARPVTPIFWGHSEELPDTARFVVMEFVTASPLDKHLVEGALSEKEACNLGIQLFEFIQILHENNKSYPDIKKENFRWEDARLRVIDVGALGNNLDDQNNRRDLFQTALILLGQCIVNIPDYDRILLKLSGQSIGEVLQTSKSSLTKGMKYVFTRLFHDDYDQRYQSAHDVISDLKIIYRAHSQEKGEICRILGSLIEQTAKDVLSPEERSQKKKEIFFLSSVLNLVPNKDSDVLTVLQKAETTYRRATLEEAIEKFKANPHRAKVLFQEIVQSDDFEGEYSVLDNAWRWLWGCSVVKSYPDASAHLEELLPKIDVALDKPVMFEAGAKAIYLHDPYYRYIQKQVTFLDHLSKSDLELARNTLKELPDEYQNARRVELAVLEEKQALHTEFSDQLSKISDTVLNYAEMITLLTHTRQKIVSINLANLWWDAILKATENLVTREEYKQAEAVLEIAFSYPGYAKKMIEYLELTKALVLIQYDLALGNLGHAVTVWLSCSKFSEATQSIPFREKILKSRDEIYLCGDLAACGMLEEYFDQHSESDWTGSQKNGKSWPELKTEMAPVLTVNRSAANYLFSKLTSNNPVLGENIDFPVRLLFREKDQTVDQINYKKALLEDTYRQLLSVPEQDPEELKIKRDQGLKFLSEKSEQRSANSSSLNRTHLEQELNSCETQYQLLTSDPILLLDQDEAWRKRIIALINAIYQLLINSWDDKELQDWMWRALSMMGPDPELDFRTLIAEVRGKSSLKKKLDQFAEGKIDAQEVKKQLQKEVFRSKMEYQNYLSCIDNLLSLKKLESTYAESASLDQKQAWIHDVAHSELSLPKSYWTSSFVRRNLMQIVISTSENVISRKGNLKKNLALWVYADKAIKRMDDLMLPDIYLEN